MEGFIFFESVYWRFVLDISKSGKFQSTVKDKATIDVYWCVFIHFVAFCGSSVCKIATLCVVHNSVGSALLVPTVDGHTRASRCGTGGGTVPALFCSVT